MKPSAEDTRVQCLELAATLKHAAIEARIQLTGSSSDQAESVLSALRLMRDNLAAGLGVSSMRFPKQGTPMLELTLTDAATPEHVSALIERIQQLVHALYEDDPGYGLDDRAGDRRAHGEGKVESASPVQMDTTSATSLPEPGHRDSAHSDPAAGSALAESSLPVAQLLGLQSLEETLQALFDGASGRARKPFRPDEKQIFDARIGLLAPFQTLEALGDNPDFGVTRERIRQIFDRNITRIQEDAVVAAFLKTLARQLLGEIAGRSSQSPPQVVTAGASCPISCLRIHSVYEDGGGWSDELQALKRFMDAFLVDEDGDPLFSLVELNDEQVAIFQTADEDELKSLETRLLAQIKHYSRQGLVRAGVLLPAFKQVFSAASEAAAQRVRTLFHAELHWSDSPWTSPDAILTSRGGSIRAALAAILARVKEPINKTGLLSMARKAPWNLAQSASSISNVIFNLTDDPANLEHDDVFVPIFQIKRGWYGSTQHMPVDLASLHEDAEQAALLIVNGRTTPKADQPYQWHCVDLVAELLERGHCKWLLKAEEGQRWELLDSLLRLHLPSSVVNLTKGYWTARQADLEPDEHVRQSQSDLVASVLARSQRMSTTELEEEVRRYQSLGAQQRLQEPVYPVVRDAGEWFIDPP